MLGSHSDAGAAQGKDVSLEARVDGVRLHGYRVQRRRNTGFLPLEQRRVAAHVYALG